MMADEKLFQNVDVCINVQTCETNSMKNVWTQVHRSLEKITCDMVVQFDCLGFMVNGSVLHRCHCPMMIKDGVKEKKCLNKIHL